MNLSHRIGALRFFLKSVNVGEGSAEGTVALCPNCHRKMYIVDSDIDPAILIEKGRQ